MAMRLFQTVKDSVYNPSFYATLPDRSFSSSMKYFARLVFLISCILALFPIIAGIVLLVNQDKVGSIRTQIVDTFPHELEVQIRNGEASTNVTEPYIVPQPPAIREEVVREMNGQTPPYEANNLLVIDTSKPIEWADFQTHRTLAILSKNEIGFYSPARRSIQIQSLDDLTLPEPLNRGSFGVFVDAAWKMIKVILIVLMILSPFLIFATLFIGYLLYLIFGALMVWLASALTQMRLTYGESYQAGLHLITLPLIASFILPFVLHIPLVFTLTLFIMALVNFGPARSAFR